MREGRFSIQANALCGALDYLCKDENAIVNFESYLSYHFDKWLEFVGGDIDNFVQEIYCFAHMYDCEEEEE